MGWHELKKASGYFICIISKQRELGMICLASDEAAVLMSFYKKKKVDCLDSLQLC